MNKYILDIHKNIISTIETIENENMKELYDLYSSNPIYKSYFKRIHKLIKKSFELSSKLTIKENKQNK